MLGLLRHRLRLPATPLCTASTLGSSRTISSASQSRSNIFHLLSKFSYSHRNAHTALQMSSQTNGTANGHLFETHGNFDLVRRLKLDFADIEVSKWQSRVTGLSVVHLDYEGTHIWNLSVNICYVERLTRTIAPLVNGYFVVRSESMSFSYFLSFVYSWLY